MAKLYKARNEDDVQVFLEGQNVTFHVPVRSDDVLPGSSQVRDRVFRALRRGVRLPTFALEGRYRVVELVQSSWNMNGPVRYVWKLKRPREIQVEHLKDGYSWVYTV